MPPAVRGVTWATAVEAIPDHPVPLRVQQARIEANEEELYFPGARLSLAITANPWQQQMINYYFNELVRGHYPFADSCISSLIRHALQRSPVVCGTAALLAQLHHQHVLTDRAHTELRTRLLTQLHDDAKDLIGDSCESPDNVFAVLQLASCFSFLGGCEERSHYLAQAIKWVQGLLGGDPLTVVQREGEWVRFLIKVTMWFDVLDAVTRGDAPQLLAYYRLLYARASRHMDEGTDPASMLPISGCESGVVLVLAEIAALAAWKRDENAANHFFTVQLLYMGNKIRNQLLDLSELDAASASTENETTSTRTVERAVFRACAHVYLHTVLSNNKQDCHHIATAAAETVSLLARLPTSHLVLRLVVLGICIAGCMNDSSETRQALAGRFTRESIEVILSNGSSVNIQLSQLLGAYPRPFSESRVPPLCLLTSWLWENEVESTCTRDHPESFDLVPSLIPSTFEARSKRRSSGSSQLFDDEVAFATLTIPRMIVNDGSEAADVDRILATLTASAESREHYLALRGTDACKLLDALQLWLDNNSEHKCWRKAMRLLIDVASQSDQLPQSLFVTDVDIGTSRFPRHFGSFADVYQGTHHGRAIAVKLLRINETGPALNTAHRTFCKEALLWRQLNHPHILKFIGVDGTTFREAISLAMVSVWMNEGTIMQFIKGTKYRVKPDRRRLIIDVAKGLEYLHNLDVTHGDLHGSNVFVTDEGRACLADFGLAVIGDLTRTRMPTTTEVFGTFRWLAPELCQSENEMTRKTLAGDVFAFGRLCLAVCTQRAPFHGVSDYTVVFKLMKGEKPDRPSEQDCAGYPMSDDLWQLANDCWEALPGGRPKIFEVLERLQDLDDCV